MRRMEGVTLIDRTELDAESTAEQIVGLLS
jgi:hypothetical protein